eukprot:6491142-Amphidinium_carterae.1
MAVCQDVESVSEGAALEYVEVEVVESGDMDDQVDVVVVVDGVVVVDDAVSRPTVLRCEVVVVVVVLGVCFTDVVWWLVVVVWLSLWWAKESGFDKDSGPQSHKSPSAQVTKRTSASRSKGKPQDKQREVTHRGNGRGPEASRLTAHSLDLLECRLEVLRVTDSQLLADVAASDVSGIALALILSRLSPCVGEQETIVRAQHARGTWYPATRVSRQRQGGPRPCHLRLNNTLHVGIDVLTRPYPARVQDKQAAKVPHVPVRDEGENGKVSEGG